MNTEFIHKRTTSFQDFLLELLADPESAKYYLEISLEDYEEDGDTEMLAHSIRNVVEAQGGTEKLASRTNGSLQALYETLEAKHSPRLNNLLEILSGLGFNTRICLERSVLHEEVNAYTEDMLAIESGDSTV